MPKSKKNKSVADSRPVDKEAALRPATSRRTTLTLIAAFVIVILIIIGATLYPTQIAPLRRTIITIDGTTIRMDYFLKRAELSGSDALNMLTVLTNEEIIKIQAPKYGIEVTPEDTDQELRRIASGGSGNITESEFREWYRQQLNESRVSDAEFKELVRMQLLAARLHEYLAVRVPTIAPQVHLQFIQVSNYNEAIVVKERWEAGEDFTDLVREVSQHESAENGGEIGWFPEGVLDDSLDYEAFSLDIGQLSDPIPYSSNPQEASSEDDFVYFLLMVSEKAAAREIDEASMASLKSKALDDWLNQERQYHDIKFNFNSEINAWINWQLSKRAGTSQQ
ncbi:peptidylprolyl isomerase [Chloroflexota bacterium]